jgi:hypothetical protein
MIPSPTGAPEIFTIWCIGIAIFGLLCVAGYALKRWWWL